MQWGKSVPAPNTLGRWIVAVPKKGHLPDMVVAAVAVLSQRTRRPRRVKPPDTHADDRVLIRAHRPGAGTDCINYENSQSIRRWVPLYVEPAIATRFKKVATTRLAKTDIGDTHTQSSRSVASFRCNGYAPPGQYSSYGETATYAKRHTSSPPPDRGTSPRVLPAGFSVSSYALCGETKEINVLI